MSTQVIEKYIKENFNNIDYADIQCWKKTDDTWTNRLMVLNMNRVSSNNVTLNIPVELHLPSPDITIQNNAYHTHDFIRLTVELSKEEIETIKNLIKTAKTNTTSYKFILQYDSKDYGALTNNGLIEHKLYLELYTPGKYKIKTYTYLIAREIVDLKKVKELNLNRYENGKFKAIFGITTIPYKSALMLT